MKSYICFLKLFPHQQSILKDEKYLKIFILTVIAKTLFIYWCVNLHYTGWEWFYLGQKNNLKQRIRKHESDVFHAQNSFCKKCSEHLRNCSTMKEMTSFKNLPIFI